MEELLARAPLVLLVSSRLGGVVASSPVFSGRFFPVQVRVAISFLLALLIVPNVRPVPEALTGTGLLPACVLELLVGLIIGFLGQLVFASVQMAGALMDTDLGFSMAQIMDPITGRSEPIMGSLFQAMALAMYFSLNAHHWLLRAIADSYLVIPAGGLAAPSAGFQHAVLLFGTMLGAAVKMVLPFMGTLLLATTALAAMNRALPQMHVFAVGMGLRSLLGLLMITLLIPYLPAFIESIFSIGHSELLRTLELLR